MEQHYNPQSLNLSCDNYNLAQLFCSSQNCFNCALLCREASCKCLPHNHHGCQYVYAQNFINKILAKRKQMNSNLIQAANAIQHIYQQVIDRISKDRQQFIQWRDNYGLNKHQIQLLNLLVSTKGKRVTGDKVYQVKRNINISMNNFITQNTIKNFWKRQKKQFSKVFNTINQLYQIRKYRIESIIIKQKPKIQKLYSFFNQPVQQFKLLYRASQNQFSTNQFHKKCDGVNHTLTLIKTQYNKIIGGYTPFPWKASENLQSTQDPEKKSFVFSLTLQQKYPLVGVKHALGHHASCGPCFGRFQNDIGISDKSNISDKSICDFPNQYNNGNLNKSQKMTEEFCGATKGNKVKFTQWQVFQVIWKFPEDFEQNSLQEKGVIMDIQTN